MRPTFIAGGYDLAKCVNKYRYSVGYTWELGANNGKLLNGDEVVDVLKTKAVLAVTFNLLTDEEITLISTLFTQPYIVITYRDTRAGGDRTATFIPSLSAAQIGIMTADKTVWRDGITLSLREK